MEILFAPGIVLCRPWGPNGARPRADPLWGRRPRRGRRNLSARPGDRLESQIRSCLRELGEHSQWWCPGARVYSSYYLESGARVSRMAGMLRGQGGGHSRPDGAATPGRRSRFRVGLRARRGEPPLARVAAACTSVEDARRRRCTQVWLQGSAMVTRLMMAATAVMMAATIAVARLTRGG